MTVNTHRRSNFIFPIVVTTALLTPGFFLGLGMKMSLFSSNEDDLTILKLECCLKVRKGLLLSGLLKLLYNQPKLPLITMTLITKAEKGKNISFVQITDHFISYARQEKCQVQPEQLI